ncbi:leucine-rich repeat protein kinase family protein [Actinidia rufa]|uniref:Leucine-rich repeat protein kinase family protein n=1 Tax=Actinidia rufa TaxID=165716 RepID=A0A7J0EBV3_9ERIC|nr:leucine-rich repeat protein kinase family protein [Actinidia rufa]
MLLNLLISLFLAPILVQSTDQALNDDVLGLIVFKAGLSDPESKLNSWNEDDDVPCNWVGVKCDPRTNRVSELVLNGFSLSGHIGKSLLRLQFLRILSLSKNNFTGSINPILAQFQSLRVIDLSENGLSGLIPDEIFRQCRFLRVISLARNNLSGPIPDSLSSCSTLEGSNKFTGQIPEDIGGCLLLKSLDFSDNSLSGLLPESMQKLSLCNSLSLRRNSFTGEVPDWVGNMRGLESLDLSANNFSGPIPNSIGDLELLKELNLSTNKFTGSLPKSLTSCINLSALDVSKNSLIGNLPPWIFNLGLQSVSLSGNRLTGRMEYDSLSSKATSYRSLKILDLSSNSLSGEIPSVIRRFSSLQLLNLSRNSLIGSVPITIGELKTTQVLDLSFNQLNGSIPSEIGGAVSLHELRLETNFITGTIPSEIENCSSLTSLILSKNNLTGLVPVAISNLFLISKIVDLSFNDLSGTLPKELTNLSHLLIFNISHNHLHGELPVGGFFNNIPLSSVSGNPSLCGSILNHSCPAVHPKPIVLNPNSSSNGGSLSPKLHRKRIVLSIISALVAISAAVFIVLGVVIVTVLNFHARPSTSPSAAALFTMSRDDDLSHSPTIDSNYGKLVMFSGEAGFVAGTHALLNKDCELGRGGFGAVYQTVLQDGRPMAIKKLNISSLIKSQEVFEKEIKKLGKIKHPNLVAIEGYYWTPSLQLLFNEFVSGGSLYKHLHEGQSENCLTWQQRFNLILGTAKALSHLHQVNTIHYNIKSTNVLIDNSGEPKLGDFGLARLLPMLDRYIFKQQDSERTWGKRPVEYMEDDVVVLSDVVRGALEEGRCGGMGRWVPSNRPDMGEVVKILELIQCPSEGEWA